MHSRSIARRASRGDYGGAADRDAPDEGIVPFGDDDERTMSNFRRMGRLIDFYATQARILWEWRGGPWALFKRLVITPARVDGLVSC